MHPGDRLSSLAAHLRPGVLPRLAHVLWILTVEPLLMRLAYRAARVERRARIMLGTLRHGARLRAARARLGKTRGDPARRPKTTLADLGLEPKQRAALQRQLAGGEEVVVAEVDQDGFYLSHVGPIASLPTVSQSEFLPRRRFPVQLVARQDGVGVKKSFGRLAARFLNELTALDTLRRAGCRVPSILDVDFDRRTITTDLILGDVLRERLARQGAPLRDRDVLGGAELPPAAESEPRRRRIEAGARLVDRVVDRRFADEVFRQLRSMHASHIAWGDFKYGNIIIEKESGLPYLIDFDAAWHLPGMSRASFRVFSDADVELFNQHFHRAEWTHRRIARYVRSGEENPLNRAFYAPASVGHGVRFGRVWSIASGFGRWNYILRDNLPRMAGRRVLVLGANNGLNALELLRAGARQVVAVERCGEAIEQGTLLRALYEWADYRAYDLQYVQADMASLPNMDLGPFDAALALCCLYYLGTEDMRRVTRHLSRVAPVFVLQANHARGLHRESQETFAKSRIEFLEQLLRSNGYEDTRVVSYRGYPRPLVIGRVGPREPAVRPPHGPRDESVPPRRRTVGG